MHEKKPVRIIPIYLMAIVNQIVLKTAAHMVPIAWPAPVGIVQNAMHRPFVWQQTVTMVTRWLTDHASLLTSAAGIIARIVH